LDVAAKSCRKIFFLAPRTLFLLQGKEMCQEKKSCAKKKNLGARKKLFCHFFKKNFLASEIFL